MHFLWLRKTDNMQLKKYQQDTLEVLKRFFRECRISGAGDAFEHYDDNLQHAQWLAIIYPEKI